MAGGKFGGVIALVFGLIVIGIRYLFKQGGELGSVLFVMGAAWILIGIFQMLGGGRPSEETPGFKRRSVLRGR